MLWRIYYADGSVFDSARGDPGDAPPTGVVCIRQANRMHGWTTTAMKDFYLWQHEQWWGADEVGFWQFMFRAGQKVALFGVSVPDETFHRIMGAAINDPAFGVKSAKSPLDFGETKPWN
jgi:hypothetical protein